MELFELYKLNMNTFIHVSFTYYSKEDPITYALSKLQYFS